MEGFIIPVIIIMVLGFVALSMAMGSENRTKSDYQRSTAERERAEADRERAAQERELAVHQIAQDKALALVDARTTAEQRIIEADRRSLQSVYEKAEQAGGLRVTFSEIQKDNGDVDPVIDWVWEPFGNAVLKIHRNQGGIVEDIEGIKSNTDLVFVETDESAGRFQDKDAKDGETYNYYVFIEARRDGFRSKSVSLPIPSQLGGGDIIDQLGQQVTHFDTVEPESYEESLYFGLKSRRVTLMPKEDELDNHRRQLNRRKSKIELSKMEAKLAKIEQDMDDQDREFTEDDVEELLTEAKIKKKKNQKLKALIARIETDPDLDAEEKEELVEQIIARKT